MGRRGSREIRANSNRIQTWSISFHRGILACNITCSLRGRLFRNWTRDVVKPLSRPTLPQPNSRVIYIFQLDPTHLRSSSNNLYLTSPCFICLFSSFVLKNDFENCTIKLSKSIKWHESASHHALGYFFFFSLGNIRKSFYNRVSIIFRTYFYFFPSISISSTLLLNIRFRYLKRSVDTIEISFKARAIFHNYEIYDLRFVSSTKGTKRNSPPSRSVKTQITPW